MTTRSSDMIRPQVVVDDLAGDESEISAPEKAFQRFRNRQPKYGSLRVRPQFDRTRTSPTFMNDHVGQMARGQLPDCRRAVDMVDDFQVQICGEVEMRLHLRRIGDALLVRHGGGDNIDAVALDFSNDQIASKGKLRLGQLFGLAVGLATVGYANFRT